VRKYLKFEEKRNLSASFLLYDERMAAFLFELQGGHSRIQMEEL